ncbi:MAG: hypothetical protein WD378_03245 [Egicoccus sp.]
MSTGCGRIRGGALVVLTALALSNCSSPDPQARLREAADATFDDAFSFTVEITGDANAPVGVEVAGLLDGAGLRGTRDAAGAVAVAYEIGASAPLFEIRTGADGGPLLRMGMADLLGADSGGVGSGAESGADPETVVGPLLDERGVTGEQRAALLAGFVGDWIELEDVEALGALAPGGAPPGAGDEAAEDPMEDADWRDAIAVTHVAEDGEMVTYTVQVDVEALRQALTVRIGSPLLGPQVPAEAPGTVTVVDGRVHAFDVDLGADDAATDAMLEVRLDDHGTAEVAAAPEPVARVSTADLAALVEVLQSSP